METLTTLVVFFAGVAVIYVAVSLLWDLWERIKKGRKGGE
jgi:Co/Zn/Cd efflux system component